MAKRILTTVRFAQQRTLQKGAGRIKQFMVLVFFSFLLSSSGQAQAGNAGPLLSLLPDSPSAKEWELRERFGNNPERETLGEVPPALVMLTAPPTRPARAFDRKFVVLQLFQLATTIADIETTRYGLSQGTQEGNPIFGRHPSVRSLYAISLPLDLGFGLWSYHLKKTAPHSRNWQIPPTMCGAAHSAAVIHNLYRETE